MVCQNILRVYFSYVTEYLLEKNIFVLFDWLSYKNIRTDLFYDRFIGFILFQGSAGKNASYYMGSTASLPRGAALLRAYSPAVGALPPDRIKAIPTGKKANISYTDVCMRNETRWRSHWYLIRKLTREQHAFNFWKYLVGSFGASSSDSCDLFLFFFHVNSPLKNKRLTKLYASGEGINCYKGAPPKPQRVYSGAPRATDGPPRPPERFVPFQRPANSLFNIPGGSEPPRTCS